MHQDMQGDVMQKLTGNVVVKGVGSGQALVTQKPINFAAALAGDYQYNPWQTGSNTRSATRAFSKKY